MARCPLWRFAADAGGQTPRAPAWMCIACLPSTSPCAATVTVRVVPSRRMAMSPAPVTWFIGTGPSAPLSLSPAGSAAVGLLAVLAAVGFLSLPPEVTSRTAATARAPSAASAITAMLRPPDPEREGGGAAGGGAAGGGAAGGGAAGGGAAGCADACVDWAKGGIEAPDGGADAGVEGGGPAHDSGAAGIGVGGGVGVGGTAPPRLTGGGTAPALQAWCWSAIASRAAAAISPAVP